MTDIVEKEERIRSEIPTQKVQSAFIKAGAGAGKTSLLVERIYQQLVRGVEPARIAAITFTNKAANEMYDRISRKLQEKERQLLPGEERETVARARRQMEEMQISTIHSFCRTVVEEFPFFAGLSLDMKELGDAEAENLQKTVLIRFQQHCRNREELQETETLWHCNEQFSDNMKAVKEKMGRSLSEKDCGNYIYSLNALTGRNGLADIRLEGLFAQRENEKLSDICYAEAAAEAEKIRQDAADWLENMFTDLKAELQILIKDPDTKPSTVKKLEEVSDGLAKNDTEGLKGILKGKSAEELAQLWSERDRAETTEEILFRSYAHKCPEWPGLSFGTTKEMQPLQSWWKDNHQKYQDGLEAVLERYAALRCNVILGLCKELLEYYLQYEDQEKIIGNHNIVSRALQIIQDHQIIAEKLAERFDTIYIDEYQDTDAQQAAFFQRLWEVAKGRLKLFYIGDAKQSIYAFRGADPSQFKRQEELFRDAEKEGKDGRRVLDLHFNYRSNKAICEWINKEFKEDYPGEEMVAKSPSRKGRDDQLYGVYHFPAEKEDASTEEQAARVAELVEKLIDGGAYIFDPETVSEENTEGLRPVRASDFLLLFWKTGNMEIFQRALYEKELPVRMDGRVHFSQNWAYQRLIAILEYCVYGKKYYQYQALALCPNMNVAELKRLRMESGKMLPAAFVRFLIASNLLFNGYADSREALAGLCHAMEEAAQSPYTDLGEFLKLLPRNKENDHTLSLAKQEEDHIRLMNIHKAKGLEGRIVICCEKHGEPKYGIHTEQDEEQYRNLEYVMYTRAREALIFAGDSLPEGRTAEELDLSQFLASGKTGSVNAVDVRKDEELPDVCLEENTERRNPKIVLVNPSLGKKKIQAASGNDGEVQGEEPESEQESESANYQERPYGNRLGLILHRVMELAVNERENLCALAERAERENEKDMPEEMRKTVEVLLRFAVAEELQEPLSERNRKELLLSSETDDLESVCDAVREYVFAFLYNTYLQAEYRHFVRDCKTYTELPFFVHRKSADGKEEAVHGIMDLVVREELSDGSMRYIVADYKTNCQLQGETESAYRKRLQEKYDRQLELYKEILRELFGLPEEVLIETSIISYYMK